MSSGTGPEISFALFAHFSFFAAIFTALFSSLHLHFNGAAVTTEWLATSAVPQCQLQSPTAECSLYKFITSKPRIYSCSVLDRGLVLTDSPFGRVVVVTTPAMEPKYPPPPHPLP